MAVAAQITELRPQRTLETLVEVKVEDLVDFCATIHAAHEVLIEIGGGDRDTPIDDYFDNVRDRLERLIVSGSTDGPSPEDDDPLAVTTYA